MPNTQHLIAVRIASAPIPGAADDLFEAWITWRPAQLGASTPAIADHDRGVASAARLLDDRDGLSSHPARGLDHFKHRKTIAVAKVEIAAAFGQRRQGQ